ncbi:MAG: YigZ family protein [Bacilli bacterium]|nr:YigZ family protein [Bacilli bacterium]
MKSIKEDVNNEIIINKSKFITFLFKIDNIDEVEKKINIVKDKYKDATHYCYAYIIDDKIKCSDDKEPSGTAGIPILNVLKSNSLNHILCVVVRYFGGIKLGAGGLLRAYSNSVSDAIKCASICNLVDGKIIEISFKYDDEKNINILLKNINIINKDYNEFITYKIEIPNNKYDLIINSLKKICININILEEKKLSIA